MEPYIDLFQKLGLSLDREDPYQGAEQYAREFKRCSILETYNTFYSVDSIVEPSSISDQVKNIQSYSSVDK